MRAYIKLLLLPSYSLICDTQFYHYSIDFFMILSSYLTFVFRQNKNDLNPITHGLSVECFTTSWWFIKNTIFFRNISCKILSTTDSSFFSKQLLIRTSVICQTHESFFTLETKIMLSYYRLIVYQFFALDLLFTGSTGRSLDKALGSIPLE